MYTKKAAEKHKYITWKITTIILWIHFFMVLKSMNTNLMWQNKFSVTMLYLQLTYSDMRILKTILQICQQKHIPGHTWWQTSVMEWYTAILWVCSSTFSTENVQNNFTFTSISDKFRSSNKHWIKPRRVRQKILMPLNTLHQSCQTEGPLSTTFVLSGEPHMTTNFFILKFRNIQCAYK